MPLYETMDEVSSEAVLTTENEKAPLAAALTRLCLQTRAMLSMLCVPKDELVNKTPRQAVEIED